MSAKTNNAIRMDIDAMEEVLQSAVSLVDTFKSKMEDFTSAYKALSDPELFESGADGAELSETMQQALRIANETIDANAEKLGNFVRILSSMAQQLGIDTKTVNSKAEELKAASLKKKEEVANATA